MDSYDVHVHPIQFQLYNKESFWTESEWYISLSKGHTTRNHRANTDLN